MYTVVHVAVNVKPNLRYLECAVHYTGSAHSGREHDKIDGLLCVLRDFNCLLGREE